MAPRVSCADNGRFRYVGCIALTLSGKPFAPAGACQTRYRAGKIPHLQVPEKGSAMPSDDWATRHPELVHWLHQAEEELVGYAPIDDLPTPVAVFPERLLPFFTVIEPSVGPQGQPRHRWASMECLYSYADMDTLRRFLRRCMGSGIPSCSTTASAVLRARVSSSSNSRPSSLGSSPSRLSALRTNGSPPSRTCARWRPKPMALQDWYREEQRAGPLPLHTDRPGVSDEM